MACRRSSTRSPSLRKPTHLSLLRLVCRPITQQCPQARWAVRQFATRPIRRHLRRTSLENLLARTACPQHPLHCLRAPPSTRQTSIVKTCNASTMAWFHRRLATATSQLRRARFQRAHRKLPRPSLMMQSRLLPLSPPQRARRRRRASRQAPTLSSPTTSSRQKSSWRL